MQRSIFVWSGGKDSAFALYKAQKEKEYEVERLLTSVSDFDRISMHGVRTVLLDKQSESLGIPLNVIKLHENASVEEYEEIMDSQLKIFQKQGFTHCLFGDIFLEDIRMYREKQMKRAGMNAVFPLWKRNSMYLIKEFIDLGFKSVIVCVDERYLDKSFVGRIIDKSLLNDIPSNVDPCGENGEYHSFVFDGPNFKMPVNFYTGEIVYKQYKSHSTDEDSLNGFWFIDLLNE